MKEAITWLHLSDIHFNKHTEWRDETSREALLTYLLEIFQSDSALRPDLIFCTGDIAFGEISGNSLQDQYQVAEKFFDKLLNICGTSHSPLSKERLFVVPGNHDVNRKSINSDAQTTLVSWAKASEKHVNIINSRFEECSKEFVDAIGRLSEYGKFVKNYLPHQEDSHGRHHYAKLIDVKGIKVGISGFNSAWSCAGPEDDRNVWLAANWQFNAAHSEISSADLRIGLIHHPVDWLANADRDIANRRISSDYDFWLHGHSHNAWVSPIQSHVVIAAGAVGADHSDEFGINITRVDFSMQRVAIGLHKTAAGNRGWTVAPIPIHAPMGQWHTVLPARLQTSSSNDIGLAQVNGDSMENRDDAKNDNLVSRYFSKRLEDALRSFSTQKNIWIDRVLCHESEIAKDAAKAQKTELRTLIENPTSLVIKAPAQYGLTCLAHHLVKEAWDKKGQSLWLYLDSRKLKSNKAAVEEAMSDELTLIGRVESDIKCVILDSWNAEEKQLIKLLNVVCERFQNVPVICMQQINAGGFSAEQIEVNSRNFDILYLWSLSRNNVRNMVAIYNEVKLIGDEDIVTNRLVTDLHALNLHRTPLNCLTLLKVSEFDFDENPVNRSEIIKRVLFLIFNIDSIPTYKTRPDLKDCEYVLGYFCETLMREENYYFARDFFLKTVQKFCKDNLIDLETHVVFDVLYENNILIKQGNFFCFKFSYWIFYFAAQRMYQDEKFAEFILKDMRYARYPEVIEFYTGIDRRREDALKILSSDLKDCVREIKEKCGLPDNLNPYRFAKWEPSAETHKQMEEEITHSVLASSLPAEIKDEYADRHYDPARPYDQKVGELLNQFSFTHMLKAMSAASRALRNSDYVSPLIKRELLTEIMNCWNQASKVLFIILPILAKNKYAAYDGMTFVLSSGFGETPEKRFLQVLSVIPQNVMNWTKDDLYSRKMGPLLIDQFNNNQIGLVEKHSLALLLIEKRPRDWEKHLQRYISSCEKNSFYLMDVYLALRAQYRYGFATSQTLRDIEQLIKMVATKHATGEKMPGEKSIGKMKFKPTILPTREIN